MHEPSYLKLLNNGEFKRRSRILKDMLANCVLCPHQCQVNRLKGEKGFCRTLNNVILSGTEVHLGEEAELVGDHGSGTIFFSNCNLKCVFCQNYEISHCGEGYPVSPQELAKSMLSLQETKCHNINLVSPSHIIPQIVEAIYIAAQNGLNIPIVYNSGGYDLIDSLKLLDGIIDIYMPDIKFSDDKAGFKYLGVKDYYKITTKAIKEMYRQVGNLKTNTKNIAIKGLLIRHLVFPQNLAGTEKIMRFIREEISSDTYINIMAQYYPAYKAIAYPELNRGITREEYRDVINIAKSTGLNRYHYQPF